MLNTNNLLLALLTIGFLSPTACSSSDQAAQQSAPTAQQSQMQKDNNILMDSASPFEDLTEFAVAADVAGMDRALDVIEERSGITRSTLDPVRRDKYDSLWASIRAGRKGGTYTDVALNSVESYRVLIEGLHDEVLTVPKAVSLLDYAGFRLSVLASLETPDWAAIRVTMEEARSFWAAISGRIQSKGLHDAMNTTIDGIERAVEARDARMTVFAAHVDLDLVDLLESHFEEIGQVGRKNP